MANVRRSMKLGRLDPPGGFTKMPEAFTKTRAAERSEQILLAMADVIATIPRGKVASYSQVAAAAGYPRHIRMVPRALQQHGDGLAWHRVLGAGGVIKLPGAEASEQRLRLRAEGVRFRGEKVDLAAHQYQF